MFNRLNKLFKREKSVISEILSSPGNRETLIGMLRQAPPTQEEMLEDANKVIQFCRTEDYAVWLKEAWAMAIKCMDKLTSESLTDAQVNYFRGCLAQNLDLIRMSYRAHQFKEAERMKKVQEETHQTGRHLRYSSNLSPLDTK